MKSLFDTLELHKKKDQIGVASQLGISLEELKYYDSCHKIPALSIIKKLANIFGISEKKLRLKLGDYSPSIIEEIIFHDSLNETSAIEEQTQVDIRPVFETQLGKLYENDCIAVMQGLPDASVDLIFADPPFNLSKEYPSGIDDSLKDDEYLSWCRQWIEEAIRILKFGGSLFLWNLPKWHVALAGDLDKKLTFRNWISVDMKYSLPIPGRLYPSHYSLLYYVKGEKPNVFHPDRVPMQVCRHCFHEIKDYGGYKNKMNPSGINIADIWTDIPPVRHSKYKKRQSANELSVKLLDRIIEMSTNEGDVVFDPFGGSGTTYVVAELKGRRWIGVDIGDTACIISRFANISNDKANLTEIRKKLNCLFTQSTEKKRNELKIWTPDTLGSMAQTKATIFHSDNQLFFELKDGN